MRSLLLLSMVFLICCIAACTPLVHDQLESDTMIVEQLADSLGYEAAECYIVERVSDGNMTSKEGDMLLDKLNKRKMKCNDH